MFRRLEQGRKSPATELWMLYLRAYELLWNLPRASLIATPKEDNFQADAGLLARVIRVYARDWVRGSARCAVLLRPYLEKMSVDSAPSWLDALQAGSCELPPSGLVDEEEDEAEAGLHPVEDVRLVGAAATPPKVASTADRRRPRSPRDYTELMESLGVHLPPGELIARYYREHSSPYLVPFPIREQKRSTDPLPEGLDLWDPSSPLAELDWVESLVRSPVVIPGVTTVERRYGHTDGQRPEKLPLDLYLGIDCSGSMPNPSYVFSFPVLAGAVILRSGLRVGARVQVTLSGEPGSWTSTKTFIRDEAAAMRVLTGYLGTGYAFGIIRLKETFLDQPPPKRPVHILLISDSDLFAMCRS
ncbi:MAG TPA: VWA domain-containing protein, partial [Myxococcota bacterium]|nr:VWA domain-containing protein [Myxococcota bacterium]